MNRDATFRRPGRDDVSAGFPLPEEPRPSRECHRVRNVYEEWRLVLRLCDVRADPEGAKEFVAACGDMDVRTVTTRTLAGLVRRWRAEGKTRAAVGRLMLGVADFLLWAGDAGFLRALPRFPRLPGPEPGHPRRTKSPREGLGRNTGRKGAG